MSPWSGLQRAQDGFIATIVDLDTGKVETLVRCGLIQYRPRPEVVLVGLDDLLRELAGELDARPGRWRVQTLSTAETILGDLRGRWSKFSSRPERLMLGRIGRKDLVA